MIARTFVDANVLIYAYDKQAGVKHEQALARMEQLWWSPDSALLSTQVLQEFYVNVTRKIPAPLDKRQARTIVDKYALWAQQPTLASDVIRASELEEQHKLSFWDALIVTLAIKSNADKILSEDLNHGQIICGVTIENPFI